MSNRNRSAGHNYERKIAKELKEMGYPVVTSRAESRNADAAGIDIFDPTGDFPFYIQNKVTTRYPKIHDLIERERDEQWLDKNIIVFHKKVTKKNKRFVADGEYVSMKKEDFYKLLKHMKNE